MQQPAPQPAAAFALSSLALVSDKLAGVAAYRCGSIEGKQALQRRQDKLTKAMDAAGDLNTMILHTREATTPQVVAKDGQYSLAPHASALLPVVMQANKELKQVMGRCCSFCMTLGCPLPAHHLCAWRFVPVTSSETSLLCDVLRPATNLHSNTTHAA